MYLEYNWTAGCYQPRIGDCWTSVDGYRSFPSLQEARYVLNACGLKLGRKTDSRTWAIELKGE